MPGSLRAGLAEGGGVDCCREPAPRDGLGAAFPSARTSAGKSSYVEGAAYRGIPDLTDEINMSLFNTVGVYELSGNLCCCESERAGLL